MQNHFIIEMLGIKDTNVKVWDISQGSDALIVELYTEKRQQKCPFCRCKTKRVHSYRIQPIQGPVLPNQQVKLFLRKRRYLCKDCGKTFYERLQMIDRYQRCTTSLQAEALMYTSSSSFKTAARWTGLTDTRLLRLFDRRNIKTNRVLPRAIAIDEFKGDAGGERFQTVIVDVENKHIIDILEDRKVDTIKKYLRSRDTGQVEIVVMDMSKWFKKAVCDVLNHPLIIADRFHFMRQVYWALDEVRRQVQADVDKPIRLQMKRSKKLLWKSHFNLDEDQEEKVEKLLEIDTRLREAYQLKVMMEKWFKESDHQTASKNLDHCLASLKRSGIEAFHRLRKTFINWRQEILQAFVYPYNNGYIEGVNNTIKVIKRNSYGIKGFERLKKKILWQQEMKKVMG
ncbi:transposase for IS652 [Oceanobacillus iheyensis HTE831]|uniref:Transposase for IS652 n=1 Tax=Oceanobacillus iheyensis (strain DSM 14371 / CIP 107618 / JCM 11309 / KCTC 3954 / HTE831) TaxID=221109 RepID=Q8CMC2_OCEIH|nr:ISL3 family transposase [Oceanobacillus iheyensis]BAC13372.1 transposase for IS652 [Oceanobacillus iheyensis HTE831]BAC14343.1 transposase for IS652 [Oceanobacillus iheyensis HTE831]